MTGAAASRTRGGPAPLAQMSDTFTHVELTWVEKRIENWIRFGQEVLDEVLDRRRRVFSYRPGSVFAFVRWAANDFGTTSSRIDIVRAVEPNEPYQTLPFVQPGALLAAARGQGDWPHNVYRHYWPLASAHSFAPKQAMALPAQAEEESAWSLLA